MVDEVMSLKLSSPFRGLESIVEEDAPLRRHTWYRIGGPARYLVRPKSVEQLREAVQCVCDAGKRIGHTCACYCGASFWQAGNQAPSVFSAATQHNGLPP